MIWRELHFGRHAGRTLPQVALMDPDNFFWLCGSADALRRDPGLWSQARLVHHRARHILPPEKYPEAGTAVEYCVHPDGGLCGVYLVPATGRRFPKSSDSFVRPYLDLSVPRGLKRYDKRGGKMLVWRVLLWRGYPNQRCTKRFCNDFFNDPEHFAPEVEEEALASG